MVDRHTRNRSLECSRLERRRYQTHRGYFNDLQITPDGHYAIASAGARWMERSSFLLHPPKGYRARKPDTIITVIDLEQWKILSGLHTAAIADQWLHAARVISAKWIVLDFQLSTSQSEDGLYPYLDKLISIPDLSSGPQCISHRSFLNDHLTGVNHADPVTTKNLANAACQELLHATSQPPVDALATQIFREQDVLPPAVRQRSSDLQGTEETFFVFWGNYPYYLLYRDNPPFESSAHLWYGLYNHQKSPFYDLERFDANGQKQNAQSIHHLLCGDPSLEQHGSACAGRIIDVSEQQHTLLAYCRTQHGDYAGIVRRQWLAVLHSDDFSGVGMIPLKDHPLAQLASSADGHPYAVTLTSGEILRIYALPTPSVPTGLSEPPRDELNLDFRHVS